MHLEQFSHRFLNGFLCELGFGGGCGSGGKVVHLEQFSEGAVLENSARAPYPTPKLGISARHAVSNLSGCGVGAPNPIGDPAMSKPTRKNLWGRSPAQNELQHTLVGERPVRFEQVWDAVFSRT